MRGFSSGEITPAYATFERRDHAAHSADERGHKAGLCNARSGGTGVVSCEQRLQERLLRGTLTIEKALSRACSTGFKTRSAYADTIKRLESVFPREQLYFCFFDDLRNDQRVSSPICFLVTASLAPAAIKLPKAMNVAAGTKPIPIEFSRELAKDYLPCVQELCQRFEGPPLCWRARYEKLLNGPAE